MIDKISCFTINLRTQAGAENQNLEQPPLPGVENFGNIAVIVRKERRERKGKGYEEGKSLTCTLGYASIANLIQCTGTWSSSNCRCIHAQINWRDLILAKTQLDEIAATVPKLRGCIVLIKYQYPVLLAVVVSKTWF